MNPQQIRAECDRSVARLDEAIQKTRRCKREKICWLYFSLAMAFYAVSVQPVRWFDILIAGTFAFCAAYKYHYAKLCQRQIELATIARQECIAMQTAYESDKMLQVIQHADQLEAVADLLEAEI